MAKIIGVEKTANGNSYRIDFGGGMKLWFDTWRTEDGELTGDWNQYIFHTNNARDMEISAFQSNSDNFDEALYLAREAEEAITNSDNA